MAYFPPFRFSAALFLGAALLLSGCCANDVCDCQDEQADAIRVRFSPAFSPSDLDTLIVKRYSLPLSPASKVDSVTLVQGAGQERDSITVVLNNNTPFAAVGANKLDKFGYQIRYLTQQPRQKPKPTTVLIIESIQLDGQLDGDGCCTCYTNSLKTVTAKVNGKKPGAAPDSVVVVNLKQPRSSLEVLK
ncbi:hypothetical protein [Hymenobacter sp.]|uniref:hypothetical protein n=1 Tax=Hymenobacter sp. TaxID=1898978 RepID=UPI00286C7500|nr:hypothetical protein [Hymenobacter sp.]